MKTLKKIKNQGFDLTTKSIYSIKGGMPGGAGDNPNMGTGNDPEDRPKEQKVK